MKMKKPKAKNVEVEVHPQSKYPAASSNTEDPKQTTPFYCFFPEHKFSTAEMIW